MPAIAMPNFFFNIEIGWTFPPGEFLFDGCRKTASSAEQSAIRPGGERLAVAAIILGVQGVFNGLAGFSFDRHLFSGDGGRAEARVDIFVPEALLEDAQTPARPCSARAL